MATLAAPRQTGRLMRLPLSDLRVDRAYQRPPSEPRIRKIVASFNPHALTALHVSQRVGDGKFYVVDGQHRLIALRMLGHIDAPCYVEDMTQAEEAAAFSKIQTGRASLRPADLWQADLASGDALALAVRHELDVRGLCVSRDTRRSGFSSIGTLRVIAEKAGVRVVADTLDLLLGVWGSEDRSKALRAEIVEGVARFLVTYPGQRDRLARRIMTIGPEIVLRKRHEHPGSAGVAVALALVEMHNKGGGRGTIDNTTAYGLLSRALDPIRRNGKARRQDGQGDWKPVA